MNTELFLLLKQYHEITFQEFKKDLINSIKSDILCKPKKKNICGHKRTQNRGYCRRLCDGNSCKYHLKNIKSDVSDISEDLNIYKDIYKNVITKDILLNIRIFDAPKSNIIPKYDIKKDVNDYIFNLNYKRKSLKSLITFIILYNKVRIKRQKKSIKNKKKNERKKRKKANIIKSHNSDISEIHEFNYEYILKNKKAQLFKENNEYYTYNLYEEKIKSDTPCGINCDYCGYTRYNSSPCVFRDCKNRKYDDFEFKMYKKINGKEMISKYNKKLNNNIVISDESSDEDYD